jgi:hypothetical protein
MPILLNIPSIEISLVLPKLREGAINRVRKVDK